MDSPRHRTGQRPQRVGDRADRVIAHRDDEEVTRRDRIAEFEWCGAESACGLRAPPGAANDRDNPVSSHVGREGEAQPGPAGADDHEVHGLISSPLGVPGRDEV